MTTPVSPARQVASRPANRNRFQRLFRTLHGWLGIFIFPLVFIAGITGLYMNHGKQLRSFLAPTELLSPSSQVIAAVEIGRDRALLLARRVWGKDVAINYVKEEARYGFPSFVIKKQGRYGKLYVAKPTGGYVVKSRYVKRTYSPEHQLIGFKIYWTSVMKGLHTGLIVGTPGRYVMDALSICLLLFSVTGVYLWIMPRLRRANRRRERMAG